MSNIQIVMEVQRLLHSSQKEVFNNLARFNVIIAGRRWGKSRLASFVIITQSIEKSGVYWWVSPTRDVGTPAWRLIKLTLRKSLGDIVNINETTRTIYLPNGSIIEFKSADHTTH